MTCFHPQKAFRKARPNPKTGKYPVVIVKRSSKEPGLIELPCGQCIGCRLDRSKAWAIRCMHEIQIQQEKYGKGSCFITLTYNDRNLPPDGQLEKSDFQLFLKRLRKNTKAKIRYYHCGEYGEKFSRPHFHALLFGYVPEDLRFHSYENKLPVYTSAIISKAWRDQGFALVGSATFESAAYIARYILKKQNGKKATEHYTNEDGVCLNPEYTTMSLKPGIGAEYYEKYKKEIYTTDSVVLKGQELPPPKFYSTKYEIENPEHYELIKQERQRKVAKYAKDLTPERLGARERVQSARLGQLPRQMEKT
ncbi:replication initiator protein [Microviridae sp.]|nr:replication initiator protein [Microviridae sp.]